MALSENEFDTPDLTNKLRNLLLVADFANCAKLVVSRPGWAVYAFVIQQKDQNYIATLARRAARWGRKATAFHQILNCKYWTVERK